MYLNMCTDMFATRNVKKSVFSVWNRCCFVAIIVTTSNLSTCTLAAVNDVCLGMIRREFCPRFPLTLAIPFTYHPSLHEERMILGTRCPVIKSMEDASSNSVPRVIYQTEMGQISSISLKSQWCSFKIRDIYSLACLQLLLLRRAFEYNLGLAHAVVMISEEHGSALGGVLVLVEVACTTGWAAPGCLPFSDPNKGVALWYCSLLWSHCSGMWLQSTQKWSYVLQEMMEVSKRILQFQK